jgi:hypothetical protein
MNEWRIKKSIRHSLIRHSFPLVVYHSRVVSARRSKLDSDAGLTELTMNVKLGIEGMYQTRAEYQQP